MAFKNVTSFGRRDGLSGSNIRKIIRDSNGFLWIATQDGLDRFDGRQFVVYNSSTSEKGHKTIGSDFHDIALDSSNNSIWATCSNGPLHEIDLSTGKIIKTVPLYGNGAGPVFLPIYKIIIKGSNIVAASNNGYLIEINKNDNQITRNVNVSKFVDGAFPIIADIKITADGYTWVFLDSYGILCLDKTWSKAMTVIGASMLFPNSRAKALLFNSVQYVDSNHILLGTPSGLACLNLARRSMSGLASLFGPHLKSLMDKNITGITTGTTGIFMSTSDGCYHFDVLKKEIDWLEPSADYNKRDQLNNSYALYTDERSLYIGTRDELVMLSLYPDPFTAFNESLNGSGVAIKQCYHLLAANDSIVYNCAPDGLYKTNTNSGVITRLAKGEAFYQLVRCPDGNILASGEKSLFVIVKDKLLYADQLYPELSIVDGDFIIASENYRDSLLFLASQLKKGLYIWDVRRKKISRLAATTGSPGLRDAEINNLHIVAPNILGIVCKSIYTEYDFRKKTTLHYIINDPAGRQAAPLLMDVCKLSDKYYFAAYGNGVIETNARFEATRLFAGIDGLTNNGLYKIFPVSDTSFIVSSNDGLFYCIPRAAAIEKFGAESGLQSNEFDETSGAKKERYLYFGGLGGYTRVDLKYLNTDNPVPKCWISSVEVKRPGGITEVDMNLARNKINVPEDYSQINIYLAGIMFPEPYKIRFAYRIKKLQDDWQIMGNQNFINLVGVTHGKYVLEAVAFGSHGARGTIQNVTLIIQPHWYETWWFDLIVAVFAAGLICTFFLMRIRQLKREQRIRLKLAGDLHDDLGSTINSAKVYTNLATLDKEPQKYLPLIKSAVQEAIGGIKDLIWVLDDKQNDVEDLISRVNAFAQPLCEASSIVYECHIKENLHQRNLKHEEKRSLYMMIKEALNNGIKYSQANNIKLMVDETNGSLLFAVSDDGKGFNVATAQHGDGLKNMQWRSSQIKYSCTVHSTEGQGTIVSFRKN